MIQFLFAAMVLLGGAYTLSLGRHVRMDLVYAKLPLKRKAILDLITFIFFCIFMGLMLWKGLDATWKSIALGERSDSVWGPVQWPGKMLIFVGAFLVCLQGLAKFIRDFTIARGGKNDG
jgi:TRAP-type mannitol/chloroaromatic compound transport system permease small subunit